MADFLTKRERSRRMGLIRSRNNKGTELRLIAIFRAHGITGWRRHRPLFGKPDFVFSRLTGSGLRRAQPIAVFVDGCFWHGCPKHATQPKTNAAFWRKKLAANQARDRLVTRTLRTRGWKVIRIWEHELSKKNEPRLLRPLRMHLS